MFKSLPGFREFYPDSCATRNHIFKTWRSVALSHRFEEYDAPSLEPLELFTEKSGEEIRDQLFAFTDKGKREVALRPEMTPSLARMVAAKASSLKRPIKWFSIGEQYRYERQQKGRLRAFYQFNADILGESGISADAEIISVAIQSFERFGLGHNAFWVRLSDRELWVQMLAQEGVTESEIPTLLGIIDKAEKLPEDKLISSIKEALKQSKLEAENLIERIQTFRTLSTLSEIQAFFKESNDTLQERLRSWEALLKRLDAMGYGPAIRIDMGIVRGLAYYTGFVFEVFQAKGSGRALAGGGRYDTLLQKLCGVDMPATGFAAGDVTLQNLLEEQGQLPKWIQKADAYCIYANEQAMQWALSDAQFLRNRGYILDYSLKENVSFNKQMKQAGQSGARLMLIYGEHELAKGEVCIRDTSTRHEVRVPRSALMDAFNHYISEGIPETEA